MKKSKITLSILATALFIFSCEQNNDFQKSEQTTENAVYGEPPAVTDTDENNNAPLNSTAATFQEPDRKFVRTADLSMEVENVYRSTTNIEKKIAEIGGYVTESQLQSHVISKEIFPIDTDSAKEIKKYKVKNSMTIRIPQLEMGKFLLSLGDEIKFLDFRNISAEDVSLSYISSELEKERLNSTSAKLDKIVDETGKIQDKKDIINEADTKHSQINRHKISALKMNDDVAYSTISLQLTEKEKLSETTVVNLKDYNDKFRPDFWYRAENSVNKGYYLLQSVCVGLLYLWPVFIISVFMILGIRWYNKKVRTM